MHFNFFAFLTKYEQIQGEILFNFLMSFLNPSGPFWSKYSHISDPDSLHKNKGKGVKGKVSIYTNEHWGHQSIRAQIC